MTYASKLSEVGTMPVSIAELDLDKCAYQYGQSFTNLLTYSEQLDHADWTASGGITVTANQATAPDGTLSMDLLDDDSTSSEGVYNEATIADDLSPYSGSFFLKENTASESEVILELYGGTKISGTINVNWNNGTPYLTASGNATVWSIDHIVDGIYRVSISVTNNASGNTTLRLAVWPAGFSATNTGSVYAWGAQVVTGVDPGAYVKTTSESVIGACRAGVSVAEFQDWDTGNNGATAIKGTVTHDTLKRSVMFTPTAADAQFYMNGVTPGNMSIDGSIYDTVRMKVRQMVSGGAWEGNCRFRDSGTGYSLGSTSISDPSFVVGEWQTLEWDFSGDAAWLAATITGVRVDFVTDNAGAWEIEWMDVVKKTKITGQECYNTRFTCQDTPNYTKHLKTFRFVEPIEGLPAGVDMIPSMIRSPQIAPTKITQGFGLGKRASVTLAFSDHPHHDRGIDPYVGNRSYDPEAQGTYWGKLRARTPYYQGRTIRIKTGFIQDVQSGHLLINPAGDKLLITPSGGFIEIYGDSVLNWDNFESRTYIVEEIRGTDSNGTVEVVAKDILKLADDVRSKVPLASDGVLLNDISIIATSMNVVGGTYNDPVALGTSEWVRLGDEIVQYTAISGTGTSADPWVLAGLTRTDITWGSTGDSHDADDSVQQCKAWQADNIRYIIDELLVTYAGIPSSYINAADWDAEESRWLLSINLTTIISEPTGVGTLISELQEQGYLNIWWNEVDQEIKLKAVVPPVLNAPVLLDDISNVLADSIKVKDNTSDRVSDVWIHYDKADYTSDDIGNFRKIYIAADEGAKSDDQFGDSRIKVIKSRWFNGSNTSIAQQTANRLLSNLRNIPQKVSFSMDAKDSVGTVTGDVRDLVLDNIQDADGSAATTRVQIISSKEAVTGHRYDYVGITGIGTSIFGFIGPDTLNDFTAESTENKQKYAFIADEVTQKMSDGSDSYRII